MATKNLVILTEMKNFDIWLYSLVGVGIKDIINPYNCLLKNLNFSIKTSNE